MASTRQGGEMKINLSGNECLKGLKKRVKSILKQNSDYKMPIHSDNESEAFLLPEAVGWVIYNATRGSDYKRWHVFLLLFSYAVWKVFDTIRKSLLIIAECLKYFLFILIAVILIRFLRPKAIIKNKE